MAITGKGKQKYNKKSIMYSGTDHTDDGLYIFYMHVIRKHVCSPAKLAV